MVWGSMSIKRGLNQGAGYTTRQSLKLVRGSTASSARAASFMALLVALVSVVIMSGSVCHGARDISGQAGVFDPDCPGACGRGVCPGTPGQPYTRPGGGPYYNKPGRGPYVGPSPPNNGGISGQAATLNPGPLDPNRPVCIGRCPTRPGGSYTLPPGSPYYKPGPGGAYGRPATPRNGGTELP